MPRIVLSLDGQVLREYIIDKPRLTIGRKSHNDIRIENAAVSGEHARLTTSFFTILEDLGSRNGTTVNGEPVIKQWRLKNGDIIGIVKYQLKFIEETDNPASAPPSGFDETQTWLVTPRPGSK